MEETELSGDPANRETAAPVGSNEMFSRVYSELKEMAQSKLSREYNAQSLSPTLLVHEAYLRLADSSNQWSERRYFFGAAAESMRRILIDRARERKRLKRGGEFVREDLRESQIIAPSPDEELLKIDEALQKLAQFDPESTEIVKMRYFVGMTQEEIADVTGVSVRTVKRQWAYAKAWLRTELEKEP